MLRTGCRGSPTPISPIPSEVTACGESPLIEIPFRVAASPTYPCAPRHPSPQVTDSQSCALRVCRSDPEGDTRRPRPSWPPSIRRGSQSPHGGAPLYRFNLPHCYRAVPDAPGSPWYPCESFTAPVCFPGVAGHSGARDGGMEGGYATPEKAKGRVQDDSGVPKSSSMKTLTLSLSAEARRSSETTTPYRHANTGAPGNTLPIRSLLVCTCLRSFGSNV